MPVRVVDVLEPVQVQRQYRQRVVEPAGPLHLAAQRLLEVPVVGQSGQRIGQRQAFRLLVHADVVQRDRGLPGERPQRLQVGVVELVEPVPVVQRQDTARGRQDLPVGQDRRGVGGGHRARRGVRG